MAYKYVKRVFVAYPSDVSYERDIIEEVITSINRHFRFIGYEYEFFDWKKSLPGIGHTQKDIEKEIDPCEVFLGLFWKRYGELSIYNPLISNTEEEFRYALNLYNLGYNIHIIMYFKELEDDFEDEDIKKIKMLKNEIKKLGIYAPFKDHEEFKKIVDDHLTDLLYKSFELNKNSSTSIVNQTNKVETIKEKHLSIVNHILISEYYLLITTNPNIILVRGDNSIITAILFRNGIIFKKPGYKIFFKVDNPGVASFIKTDHGVTNTDGNTSIILTANNKIGSLIITAETTINGQIMTGNAFIKIIEWGTIVGRIIDGNNRGIPNATITLFDTNKNLYKSPENPQYTISRQDVAEIGTFIFYRIPVGHYYITIEKSDHNSNIRSYSQLINVEMGTNSYEIIIHL